MVRLKVKADNSRRWPRSEGLKGELKLTETEAAKEGRRFQVDCAIMQ